MSSVFITGIALFIAGIAFSFIYDDPYSGGIGLRSFAVQDVSDTVASSTVEVSTDLTTTIAANQKIHITYYIPVTLGGTAPGVKFLVNAPASPTYFVSSVVLFTDADSVGYSNTIFAEAAQGVTLANAGDHFVKIDVTVINGATAGTVVLQFAQNVSDIAVTVVRRGAYAEITKF